MNIIKTLLMDDSETFLTAATAFLAGFPCIHVIGCVTSGHDAALRCGADAYLIKSRLAEEIMPIVRPLFPAPDHVPGAFVQDSPSDSR